VKSKNEEERTIAALDILSNLPFALEASQSLSLEKIEVEESYFASLKVYIAQNVSGVSPELVEFFAVLDVDQSIEDFLRAYRLYPRLIKFELVEAEPLQ
jgi:hypothetical protein